MNKVAIFGAGIIGQAIYALLKKDNNILCFFDNKSNMGMFDSVPVMSFNQNIDFDKVYISVMSDSIFTSIKNQLINS
jgi:UDP-N-acetylmuramoylalanine-D-glutamate ligase